MTKKNAGIASMVHLTGGQCKEVTSLLELTETDFQYDLNRVIACKIRMELLWPEHMYDRLTQSFI